MRRILRLCTVILNEKAIYIYNFMHVLVHIIYIYIDVGLLYLHCRNIIVYS